MRTQLLGALALLCGAQLANAQSWPGYANYGYNQGYNAGYSMAPGAYGSYGYPQQYARPVYPQYQQGYAAYPSNYYPGYTGGYQNYYPAMQPRAYSYQPQAVMMSQPAMASMPSNGMTMVSQPPPGPVVVETAPVPQMASPPVQYELAHAEPAAEPAFVGPTMPEHMDRWWANIGYNLLFVKPEHFSTPLVTTGAAADAHSGALGQPGTAVLFGGSDADFGVGSGLKLGGGLFLDDAGRISLEAEGMYGLTNHVRFFKQSDANGNPVLTTPVFDVVSGQEVAFIDAFPNVAAGSAAVDVSSEFWSAEANVRFHFHPYRCLHLEALYGFRTLGLTESLTMEDKVNPLTNNALTFNGAFVNPPDTLADNSSFKTTNQFYGMQVGGQLTWEEKWFSLGAFAKLGLGATDQDVNIDGTSTLFTPAGNQTATGGILGLPTNIGHYDRVTFGVVPEVGLNFALNVTPHVQLTSGYSFLYWNNVARPGNQIDPNVNVTQVPTANSFGQSTGPARPLFTFQSESYWVQSFNFGVNVHY
jgi:hypothetical protein